MKSIIALSVVAMIILLSGCVSQPSQSTSPIVPTATGTQINCNPGPLSGLGTSASAFASLPGNATIVGWTSYTDSSGVTSQMCHFTFQESEQGVAISGDAYFNQTEMCIVMSVSGQAEPQTCTPINLNQ